MLNYKKFYTPPSIAEILIKQIETSTPHTVIDICCGSYNLLYAAKKRWPSIKMVGVDIINHSSNDVECICADGRQFSIEHKEQFPLVLANPPFGFLEKKREYPELFTESMSNYNTNRLENEMLLANLHLLNESGILMIIMPSTFVESQTNKKLRIMLAQKYHIQKIIQLPDKAFGSASIRSYAIIIKKAYAKRIYTRHYSIISDADGLHISKSSIIPQKNIRNGEWGLGIIRNASCNLDMRRGNISSHMFQNDGFPVLHASRAQEDWKPSVRYINEIPKYPVYVEEGDIIVSRIGKSAGQWCIHQGEKCMISDCLYRIKDPDRKILSKLSNKKYSYIIKGVATRYITVKDFKLWLQSL